jgi:transcriptional regulator with XRE-family HTH domain
MNIGCQIIKWRRCRSLTQEELAKRANLSRVYISRLEKGGVDPALSSLHRLALALGIELGELVDQSPPHESIGRDELDRLARGALQPGTKEARNMPQVRVLARMIKERRKALGLYNPRKLSLMRKNEGQHAVRWLRASLGESQWSALLRRIDKLASGHAGSR